MEDGKNHRQALGKLGEDLACDHLVKLGHTIIARNYRSGHLEIDIISIDKDGIHFVEVKARQKNIQAAPQENVGYKKQSRITKAALSFLNSRQGIQYGNHDCSFDVVAVTFAGGQTLVEWIPQAYIPIYL
jgi:putative endonuclease